MREEGNREPGAEGGGKVQGSGRLSTECAVEAQHIALLLPVHHQSMMINFKDFPSQALFD